MPKALDIAGQRHGRLVVLCRAEVPNARNVMWKCRCDCGGTIIAAAANIGKSTSSCGCLASETATKTLQTNRLARRDLHGLSHRSEHQIWCEIKQRCNNPKNHKYPRYGGRGIKMCDRWQESFLNFLADVGDRPSKKHSLDRINNDGNYEPSNVRWATAKAQGRNTSRNRWIEVDGVRLCYIDWCEVLNVPVGRLRDMVAAKYSKYSHITTMEDAIRYLRDRKGHE